MDEARHLMVFLLFTNVAFTVAEQFPGHEMIMYFIGWCGGNAAMWYVSYMKALSKR